MGIYLYLALAMEYPGFEHFQILETHRPALEPGAVQTSLDKFIQAIKALSLGDWEELYTQTFDLSPAVAPYIGFHIWGESYQRGNLMASINRELQTYQIDLEGELPDHLVPVLRYLDVCPEPLPELQESLPPALKRMIAALRKSRSDNPYIHLLEAILNTVSDPFSFTRKEAD